MFTYEPVKESAENRFSSLKTKFFSTKQLVASFQTRRANQQQIEATSLFPTGTNSYPFSLDLNPAQKKPPTFNLVEERTMKDKSKAKNDDDEATSGAESKYKSVSLGYLNLQVYYTLKVKLIKYSDDLKLIVFKREHPILFVRSERAPLEKRISFIEMG